MRCLSFLLLTVLAAPACRSVSSRPTPAPDRSVTRAASLDPALRLTQPPYEVVHANWKERLRQTYVFVDHTGDYRGLGQAMRTLFQRCAEGDLEPSGPPFALFFDDPAQVPASELKARACLPVASDVRVPDDLGRDVMPSAMVAYSMVAGAYPDVPRAYPGMFRFLDEHGWVRAGPVREIYLVDPGDVESYAELRTEVQIPWQAGR